MPLIDLHLPIRRTAIPREIRVFLREARRRIRRFQRSSHIPAFVAGDFEYCYHVLLAISESDLAPGNLFCEWGSGFGVVTCLAAILEFDSCGIEIEPDLTEAAQALADDFALPAEFICGSFIPKGGESLMNANDNFAWLTTDESNTETELGLTIADMAVVFAYPWPDEERFTEDLFDCHAAVGAVLITHHGGEEFQVQKKAK